MLFFSYINDINRLSYVEKNVCGHTLSILADLFFSFPGMIATFSNIELVLGPVKVPHLKWMEEPVHILIPGRVMQVTD